MQLGPNNIFNNSGTDPVVTIGKFRATSVKYLHRCGRRVQRYAERFTQMHRNRQIFVHRVDVAARAFKLPIYDFLQGVVYNATSRGRCCKHIQQNLPRNASFRR